MAKHVPLEDCARPTWHMSAAYGSWSPYCREEWDSCHFQTFSQEEVTCVKCAQVAEASWGRPFKSQRLDLREETRP